MQRTRSEAEDETKNISEAQLMSSIKLTDTAQMHDTLTVSRTLVENPDKFYKIGLNLVGSNFLKIPYEFSEDEGKITTSCPPWLNPKKLFPIAWFVLFVLERALWLQHEAHCT